MLISDRLNTAGKKYHVSYPDEDGNVKVAYFASEKGARSFAARKNGVVDAVALLRKEIKTKFRIL